MKTHHCALFLKKYEVYQVSRIVLFSSNRWPLDVLTFLIYGFGPWYKEFYWIFHLNLYYSLYLRQLSLMNTDCAALAFPAAIWWFFRANQEHIIVFYSGFANHICHQRFHKSTPDERHLLFFFRNILRFSPKSIKTLLPENTVSTGWKKIEQKYFCISALVSKKRSNRKIKGTLYH